MARLMLASCLIAKQRAILDVPKSYYYQAYGLVLQLTFPCLALSPAPENAVPDVIMTEGPVRTYIYEPDAKRPRWQAKSGVFLWRGGRDVGLFLVETGSRITLERGPKAVDHLLELHFMHQVLAAVLRQRGMVVLHGSSALAPGGGVVLCGISGSGKSTTLAALINQNCKMISDEITALRAGEDGAVQIEPGSSQFHLCEDAAERLVENNAGMPRNPWNKDKVEVRAPEAVAVGCALSAIYLLTADNSGDELAVQPISGSARLSTLLDCVYSPFLPSEQIPSFPLLSLVADKTPMYHVSRPAGWSVDEIADAIISHVV